MPFTISHAAAAVPLKGFLGRHGSLSALAIGSFAPDLPHFIDIGVGAGQTHTLAGAVTYSLAIGLVGYLLFHLIVWPGMAPLLPRPLQARLESPASPVRLPKVPMLGVLMCIVLGALTHVIWDSFTHARAIDVWGSGFGTPLVTIGGHTVYVYKALQYLSGIVGLALLGYWILRWWNGTTHRNVPDRWISNRVRFMVLATMLIAPTLVGAVAGTRSASGKTMVEWTVAFLPKAAFVGGTVFLFTVLCVSAFVVLVKSRRSGS